MKPRDLVVWGASGHASVVADAVRLGEDYRIVGYLDDINPAPASLRGSPVLGGREQLPRLRGNGLEWIHIAVGNCEARLQLARLAQDAGFSFAMIIHPTATVAADSSIGEGSLLAAGSVVGPCATIERHVILNTRSGVDHHCTIGEGAHVAPGATVGGGVRVGCGTLIGLGSSVVDHTTIGDFSVIGAGAVVISDIPDGCVATGVPARVIGERRAMRATW